MAEDLSPALKQELERVAALIREKAIQSKAEDDALALVRVVNKLKAEDWEHFASINNLENWLTVPLGGSLASSVSTFLSTLERVSFQRDHDALTGLGNRRLLERRLSMEVERALRSGSELCLMIIDLDNFKQINDTLGHLCGDAVLERLGLVLAASVRPYDLAARIGGEEFVLVFPSTSCWTGLMLGNRILEKFSQEVFHCDSHTFSMTFSAGVSSIALLQGDVTNERLLGSADEAMYTAKKEGKNRVVVAASGKRSRDRASLVLSHEKQLLFSNQSSE